MRCSAGTVAGSFGRVTMTETVKCKALQAFSLFVSGYGIVHGDPDSSDDKATDPLVPVRAIAQLVEAGNIAEAGSSGKKAPKGGASTEEAPVA